MNHQGFSTIPCNGLWDMERKVRDLGAILGSFLVPAESRGIGIVLKSTRWFLSVSWTMHTAKTQCTSVLVEIWANGLGWLSSHEFTFWMSQSHLAIWVLRTLQSYLHPCLDSMRLLKNGEGGNRCCRNKLAHAPGNKILLTDLNFTQVVTTSIFYFHTS